MAFDSSKDVALAAWELEGSDLKISVNSYNGGEAKLQIGPRVYNMKSGRTGFRKAGRLTPDEVRQLAALMPEIEAAMG